MNGKKAVDGDWNSFLSPLCASPAIDEWLGQVVFFEILSQSTAVTSSTA
jgi:hypothetical protein